MYNLLITLNDKYSEMCLYNKKGDVKNKTLIDNNIIEKISMHKWNLDNHTGYVRTKINKKTIYLHRFILDINDKDSIIDHINNNKLDNRVENLRVCNKSKNAMNVKNLKSNNTSSVTGVTWDKSRNKWIAQINVNKKHIHLGRFDDFKEATKVRLKAEKKYFKEFAPIRKGE